MDWVEALAAQFAIRLKREWVDSIVSQLQLQHPDFSSWPEAKVVESIFTSFLFCDLHQAGAKALPPGAKVGRGVVYASTDADMQCTTCLQLATASTRKAISDLAGLRSPICLYVSAWHG